MDDPDEQFGPYKQHEQDRRWDQAEHHHFAP
jgi:hypothetical protein